MEPASTAGDGYIECNVFHKAPQKPLPALAVDAHYTYSMGESFNDIARDCREHLCGPSRIVALGLWLRDEGDDTADVCGEDPQPGR